MKTIDIWYVKSGPFRGYEGTLTRVAGQLMLKSLEDDCDWTYVLVARSQLDFLCCVEAA